MTGMTLAAKRSAFVIGRDATTLRLLELRIADLHASHRALARDSDGGGKRAAALNPIYGADKRLRLLRGLGVKIRHCRRCNGVRPR
jgi:hypothetical protein